MFWILQFTLILWFALMQETLLEVVSQFFEHFKSLVVIMADWSHPCFCSVPQMVFGVGKVQMKFLHLLSNEASHSITLHCLNDPPYGTTDSFSSTGSMPQENTTIRFRGWNKQMFEKDTLLEPLVLQDDCKVMSRTETWLSKCFSLRSTLSRTKQTWQLDVVL